MKRRGLGEKTQFARQSLAQQANVVHIFLPVALRQNQDRC